MLNVGNLYIDFKIGLMSLLFGSDNHSKMSLREAREAALREHNRLRALHQDTQPLELSEDLCNAAQVCSFCQIEVSVAKSKLNLRHGQTN